MFSGSTTYTVSFIFLINKRFYFLFNSSEETKDFLLLPSMVRQTPSDERHLFEAKLKTYGVYGTKFDSLFLFCLQQTLCLITESCTSHMPVRCWELQRQTDFMKITCVFYKTLTLVTQFQSAFFCMCAALSSVSIPSFPKFVSFCLYFPPKHSGYIFSSRISICLQDPTLLELKKEGDEKFQAQLYEVAAAIYTFIEINYPSMDTVIAEKLFHKRAVCFYKMVSFLF